MLPTHALAGAALAAAVEPTLVPAGGLGGIVSDLDVFFSHRRTLHGLWVPLLIGTPLLWLAPPAGVALLSVSLHGLLDLAGGGLEARQWERTSRRSVYDHLAGRWRAPLHLVHTGSRRDLGVCLLLAVGLVSVLPGQLDRLAVGGAVLATAWAIVHWTLVHRLPDETAYYELLQSYVGGVVRRRG